MDCAKGRLITMKADGHNVTADEKRTAAKSRCSNYRKWQCEEGMIHDLPYVSSVIPLLFWEVHKDMVDDPTPTHIRHIGDFPWHKLTGLTTDCRCVSFQPCSECPLGEEYVKNHCKPLPEGPDFDNTCPLCKGTGYFVPKRDHRRLTSKSEER